MLKTEIKDIGGLYKAATGDIGGTEYFNIGEVDIEYGNANPKDSGTREIKTSITPSGESFLISTRICESSYTTTPKNFLVIDFPSEVTKLNNEKNRYVLKGYGPTQAVIECNGVEYDINHRIGDSQLSIKCKFKKPSEKDFKEILEAQADIIDMIINAEWNKKNPATAEQFTYTYKLGNEIKEIPRLKKEQGSLAGLFGSINGTEEDKLGELEKRIEVREPQVTFADIGGCLEGKLQMERIYRDITHPQFAAFFGRNPDRQKGYLLQGDAGCGKTLLVRALATNVKRELDGRVKFYAVNYEDITSIYRGGEATATGQIFKLVRKNEEDGLKTLLFLDEIHLIGIRGSKLGPKDEALDTLLAHLDGINRYKGLTVIGATYMPIAELDPALTREGRLGNWITIHPPNEEERKEIVQIYLNQKDAVAKAAGNPSLFAELDVGELARATEGFNGSNLSGLIALALEEKENEVRKNIQNINSMEEIRRLFTPITTRDLIRLSQGYNKKDRKKIGF